MTMVRRTKRPRHAKRRLDLSPLKDALRDERAFPCLGLVTDEGVDSHFILDGEDLLIEVELIPEQERVLARLAFGAGPGAGIWFVPPVGSEVAVILCDGDVEAGAFIVGVLATGEVPQGIAEGTMVIASPQKVLIGDGQGGYDQVVLKTAYEAHVHATGTGASGPPDNALALTSYSQFVEVK